MSYCRSCKTFSHLNNAANDFLRRISPSRQEIFHFHGMGPRKSTNSLHEACIKPLSIRLQLMEESRKHMCALPEGPDIVDIYVRHGRLLKLRRWFRRFTMISERHPNVKLYFKSMAAVKQEMLRHLKHHYYTLHPMSKAS